MRRHLANIPYVGLETLEAVARAGSHAAAGAALHITASAVSHRLRDLEAELGIALLDRTHRRARLTPAGQQLAEAARAAQQLLNAALDDVTAEGRPLTIACSPSFAVRWLVPALDDLREHAPALAVHVSANDRGDPGARGIDGVIRYGPPGQGQALRDEEVFPVCAAHVAQRLSTPADLLAEALLYDAAHAEHPARAGWRQWLAAAGVQGDPARRLRFSHNHLALSAALAGQGVALARTSLVQADLAEGRLVAPFALRVPTGLAYRWVAGSARPEVSIFASWLLGAFTRGGAAEAG